MKIMADLHISPNTVKVLSSSGYDILRINEIMPVTASDLEIIDYAEKHGRVILTQDLDFSRIISLSGKHSPSVICLRLSSSKVYKVNSRLAEVLPLVEDELSKGCIITVEDTRVRVRYLPINSE